MAYRVRGSNLELSKLSVCYVKWKILYAYYMILKCVGSNGEALFTYYMILVKCVGSSGVVLLASYMEKCHVIRERWATTKYVFKKWM